MKNNDNVLNAYIKAYNYSHNYYDELEKLDYILQPHKPKIRKMRKEENKKDNKR